MGLNSVEAIRHLLFDGSHEEMTQALIKARVGETVKVKAPRGTMQFKILAIV